MKILLCLLAALMLASYAVEATYVDCSQDEIINDAKLNAALNVGLKWALDKAKTTYGSVSFNQVISVQKEDVTSKITYKFSLYGNNNKGTVYSIKFTVVFDVEKQESVVNQSSLDIKIILTTGSNYCAKVNVDSLINGITQFGVDYVFPLVAQKEGLSTTGVQISKVNSVTKQVTSSKITFVCDVDATNADGAVVHATFTVEYSCKTETKVVTSWSYTADCNFCAKVDADSLVKDIVQAGIEYVFEQNSLSTNNVEITNVYNVEIDKQENVIIYVCDVEATNADGVTVHSTFTVEYDCKTGENDVTITTVDVNDGHEEEEEDEDNEEEEEVPEEEEVDEPEEEEEEEEEIGEPEEEEEEEEEIEEEEEEEIDEPEEEEDEDNEEEEEVEEEEETGEPEEEEEEIEEEEEEIDEPEEEEIEEEEEEEIDEPEEEEIEEEEEEEIDEPEEEEEEIDEPEEEEIEEEEEEEIDEPEEEEIEEEEEEEEHGCHEEEEEEPHHGGCPTCGSTGVKVDVDVAVHVTIDTDEGDCNQHGGYDALTHEIVQFGAQSIFAKASIKYGVSDKNVKVTKINKVTVEKNGSKTIYTCDIKATDDEGVVLRDQFVIEYDTKTHEKSLGQWTYKILQI